MSTEQASLTAFDTPEPEPEPDGLAGIMAAVTGTTEIVEAQQRDGDRVVRDVDVDLRDGLAGALEGQEVHGE